MACWLVGFLLFGFCFVSSLRCNVCWLASFWMLVFMHKHLLLPAQLCHAIRSKGISAGRLKAGGATWEMCVVTVRMGRVRATGMCTSRPKCERTFNDLTWGITGNIHVAPSGEAPGPMPHASPHRLLLACVGTHAGAVMEAPIDPYRNWAYAPGLNI